MSSSEIERFAREWPAQRARWERFADWEREQLAAHPPDLASALAWMDQARELAQRHDPEWESADRLLARCRHHAEIQRRLGLARLS